jgi:Domain of unknown function (DUF932)
MKNGKSLVELAQELVRLKDSAKDFVVPTEKLRADVVESPDGAKQVTLNFKNETHRGFALNNWSGGQLAGYADIPKAYFDRIASENPELAAENINHGLERIVEAAKREKRQESRMVRTVDGRVRGLLSSRYRILDGHDLLESVFPVLADKGMEVVSSEITEKRLFIKALAPKLQAEVKKGDVVQFGLTISTSDVGAGSVRVEPLIYRLVCLNGMISNTAIRKFHVGKNQAEEDIRELLSDETRNLEDSAFWASVRDVVLSSMRPENFEAQVDRLRVAANEEIKNIDPLRVVELTMRATGIVGEGKKNSILAALASGNEGAGYTRYGLVNSFTRAAQAEAVSYEESIEMERAAGQILELSPKEWKTIAAIA